MDPKQLLNAETTLQDLIDAVRVQNQNRVSRFYPETGPLRRELYVKHMEFFAAGAQFRERLALCANRVGKTEGIGAYELTMHLTGLYPKWWKGRRFKRQISAWAAGDTNITTRDILQNKLLGKIVREPGDEPSAPIGLGSGIIPKSCIKSFRPKAGIANGVEVVYIKHVSGGTSILTFKSFEQGQNAFMGTEQHVIWLDEEPPMSVYSECITRTMKAGEFEGGILMVTFTPLNGWTEVVNLYKDDNERETARRWLTEATWEDAPHLSKEEREDMLRRVPPHQRDARSKGIPALGSGAIYPIPETDIVITPFEIPAHWPRAYGMDVGWNRTAAVWGALDRESRTIYLYSEHYYAHSEPSENARAIRGRLQNEMGAWTELKGRGEWIPGVIDPAARGRSQKDGSQLIQQYRDLGLKVDTAQNAVEAGLLMVWEHLIGGRLKVMGHLSNWLKEFRQYRRDEKGKVVKKFDHLMDATRYLVLSGKDKMITKPMPILNSQEPIPVGRWGTPGDGGWMAS